jgi:hypothetical protein
MYLFPSPAQTGEFAGERRLDAPQLARSEAIAFPHPRRPVRAMQIDYRAVPAADDVDVSGAMIVEVDGNAQAIEAEHGRHEPLLAETEAVGYASELSALSARLFSPSSDASPHAKPSSAWSGDSGCGGDGARAVICPKGLWP